MLSEIAQGDTRWPLECARLRAVRLPVFVDSWQIECCGERFCVGDAVAWQLLFLPVDGLKNDWRPDALIDMAPTAWRETREAGSGWVFDCATLGTGIEVALRQRPPRPDRLRGLLYEEHHGGVPESLPATHATVRRIRLATRPVHFVGTVAHPVGPLGLADVQRVPVRFNAEARGTMKDGAWIYAEGVLAEIETTP